MAAKRIFKGGCFPLREQHEGKPLSNHAPIEQAPVPERVLVPLNQHIGAASQSLVKRGDKVKTGQLIGEIHGNIGANIHAPVSGSVVDVSLMSVAMQSNVPCVVIESDGNDTLHEDIRPGEQADVDALSPEELLFRVQAAGIVGMGGAAFPTHVKLSTHKPMELLIANGAECEPFSTCDHRLMVEESEKIVRGMQIAMKVIGVQRGIVAIEKNKPDAIEVMRKAVKVDERLSVAALGVRYPQGSEQHLMYALTGKKIAVGGLPVDVGVLVQNVGTLHAIAAAVDEGMPLISRVVTVTGGVKTPKNIRARIGTSASELIDLCGGVQDGVKKLVAGGPMTGIAQYSDTMPVVKGTTTLLLLDDHYSVPKKQGPCIRCGRCVDGCPMGLMPLYISDNMFADKVEEAISYNANACIACGSCSYNCPANRPLTQGCVLARNEARSNRRRRRLEAERQAAQRGEA